MQAPRKYTEHESTDASKFFQRIIGYDAEHVLRFAVGGRRLGIVRPPCYSPLPIASKPTSEVNIRTSFALAAASGCRPLATSLFNGWLNGEHFRRAVSRRVKNRVFPSDRRPLCIHRKLGAVVVLTEVCDRHPLRSS